MEMIMFKYNLKEDNVASTPTQHHLVPFRRKISFVTFFTISKWLKKHYFVSNKKTQLPFTKYKWLKSTTFIFDGSKSGSHKKLEK